jgi:hypothetical protein
LCDGFFYPVSYATYGARLAQDATQCQSTCAAPAELYVYRNPGQDIEQAVSLNGSAYMDLPVALRFRKEYVKGCSCKQAEYNPTEIETASKRAEADPGAQPTAAAPGTPQLPPAQAAAPAAGEPSQFDLEITGSSSEPAPPPAPAPEAAPAAIPEAQQPPPLPPAAAEAPPPPPPPPAAAAAIENAPAGQSTVSKRRAPPAQPASPFGPQ